MKGVRCGRLNPHGADVRVVQGRTRGVCRRRQAYNRCRKICGRTPGVVGPYISESVTIDSKAVSTTLRKLLGGVGVGVRWGIARDDLNGTSKVLVVRELGYLVRW